MARAQFVEGSLHYHEGSNAWYLYGTEAHQNETALVHQVGTEEPVGNPNEAGELREAYDFDLVSQELADQMHSYTVKYGEVWNTRELEQDFDFGKAYFGGGMIHGIQQKETGDWGYMPFTHSPRVYYNFMREG